MSIASAARKLKELRAKQGLPEFDLEITVSTVKPKRSLWKLRPRPDIKSLLGPVGCWSCGSQEKGYHKLKCPVEMQEKEKAEGS